MKNLVNASGICQNPNCEDKAYSHYRRKDGTVIYARHCTRCKSYLTKYGNLPTERINRLKGFTEGRGICLECGEPAISATVNKDGDTVFSKYCLKCTQYKTALRKYGERVVYQKYVLKQCERCGFIAEHLGQLDIDHIIASIPKNNSPDNLMCLCANCHRLKTILNKDNRLR